LTVTTSGTGAGSVKSDLQSGIACSSSAPHGTCQVTVPSGTVVSLVPTADQGSVFDGWTGACSPLTTVACQVRVTQNMTVNAIFNLATTPPPRTTRYECVGSPFVLFDNWNTGAVANGGTQPVFDTGGKPYCLISLADYHFNNGPGVSSVGTVGLQSETTGELGPYQAVGLSASGALNADWIATVGSPTAPVVINGTYACTDSDPSTWSQNATSGGQGFCKVTVEAAVQVTGG
jgi:hypothetical protein